MLDTEPGQELTSAAQAAYQAAAVSQAGGSLARFDAAIQRAKAAIDLQLTKLEVTAPVNSVALACNVEPGGVVTAGASMLVLGRLDDLTVTVYVDEVHYGGICEGDRPV